MTLKKLIRKIHLWLGLGSGIVVLIVSVTGCLWVFEEELRPLFYAERMFVQEIPDNVKRLPVDLLINKAEAALENKYPAERMHLPTRPDESAYVQFRAFNQGKEGLDVFWYGDQVKYFYRVYINPYTGEVLKAESTKWEFFNIVLWLHMSLLLGELGHELVAYGVLLFVVLLITGLVLWWPKNKSAAKQRFWFRWKKGTKWKRKNYDLHNIPGFYVLLLAFILALTGLVWSFDWVGSSMQWIANGGKTIKDPKSEYKITASENEGVIDKIIAELDKEQPDALSHYLRFPRKKEAPLTVTVISGKGGYGNWISYQFDPFTGKRLSKTQWEDLNNGEKVSSLNYPVHVGSVWNFQGKVLAFLGSLISASLPVTGFLIWWGRKKKEKRSKRTATGEKSEAGRRA